MSPSEEYIQRRDVRRLRVANLEKIHIRLGNAKVGIFILFAILAWASFSKHVLSAWWLILAASAFVGLSAWHSKILRKRELAQRAVDFCERGLARIEDRWTGSGEAGERFADPHHVYSGDLDLFGDGSLFQLVSSARTRMGEDTLAGWLVAPSPMEVIRERHAAVRELREKTNLREAVAVLGADARVGVHPEALANWAELPAQVTWPPMRWLALGLAGLAISAAIVWALLGMVTPLVIIVAIEAAITYRLRKPIEEVLHGSENAFRDLDLLSGVLARVEEESFRSPRLQGLRRQLLSSGLPSSKAIAKLRALVDRINARHNTMVRILDAPLMYSVRVTLAAERWRRDHGPGLRLWVSAIGEIEALLSIAAYSFEHPADPFPELVEGETKFESEGLGHPLVPAAMCVRNDVAICGDTRMLLVSGSNMSGKSTLMRAVGINVVLAMAGAPVRARLLRLSPLSVGASIRVNDSLQEGSSRFYAEITRLRQIFDLAGGSPPLLFLLDELLQGTNSKDRRIGAEGIVRALVGRGSIGIVSTHDLALTDIDGSVGGSLRNVHFQDEIADGKMIFDYKLRDGVVTKSNGLELMRSIGLDV